MNRLYKKLFTEGSKKVVKVSCGKDLYFALRRNFRIPAIEAYRIAFAM